MTVGPHKGLSQGLHTFKVGSRWWCVSTILGGKGPSLLYRLRVLWRAQEGRHMNVCACPGSSARGGGARTTT